MIRVANDRTIGAEEARLLTTVHADVSLGRAAFAGHPFHINDEKRPLGAAPTKFSEAVVLRMIEAGLLFASNASPAWKERGIPVRPYTVRLTKAGEQERIRLMRHLTIQRAA